MRPQRGPQPRARQPATGSPGRLPSCVHLVPVVIRLRSEENLPNDRARKICRAECIFAPLIGKPSPFCARLTLNLTSELTRSLHYIINMKKRGWTRSLHSLRSSLNSTGPHAPTTRTASRTEDASARTRQALTQARSRHRHAIIRCQQEMQQRLIKSIRLFRRNSNIKRLRQAGLA